MSWALIIILSLSVATNASKDIPIAEFKEQMLTIHNTFRSMQKGSNMQEMVWNEKLEEDAQKWIRGCRFEHERKGHGENLAFEAMPGVSLKDEVNSSLSHWYDEIKYYWYGPHNCGKSCHYTQMVWAETREMGCAMEKCDNLYAFGRGVKDATYVACFYEPKGNDITKVPYKKGKACSECYEGQTCTSQGLCSGEPAQGAGGQQQNQCEDKNDQCEMWQKMGECNSNPNYMNQDCAKSCGKC